MNESENIRNKLDHEIERIMEETVNVVNKDKIVEIISIFKSLDTDLIPILNIIEYAIRHINDEKVNSVIIAKVIEFYGLGKEVDILETRQKISIIGNKLIKKQFLKKESIEMINILLQENNII